MNSKKLTSEQHPLFPSGEWEGIYNYKILDGMQDKMEFSLNFHEQKVSGFGSDSVGPFTWAGHYDTEKGTCQMTKQYTGQHSVFYNGHVDENGIWGTWTVEEGWSGGFHIWPKKKGQGSVKQARKKAKVKAKRSKSKVALV